MTKPRVPPHSIEAEQAILGALLIDKNAWQRIGDRITENDFYQDEHRAIYRHITRLLERGKPATMSLVAKVLKSAGEIDSAGGLAYLGELAGKAPSPDEIREHLATIVESAMLRQLLDVADKIAADALDPAGRHPVDLFAEADARLVEAAKCSGWHWDEPCHINPLLTRELERIQERHEHAGEPTVPGVRSDFADLNQMTGGFRRGDLIILAGRPAMGKTALALNIIEHVGVTESLPVLCFSLEGEDGHWIQRLLASIGQIDAQQLRNGQLTETEWARLSFALGKLHEAPIFISESERLSSARLRSQATRCTRQYGGKLGLIVVDFIQRMVPPLACAKRGEELFEICRSLKALAKELDAPVIALSELPATVEQRDNKRPMLSDLMDCGPIEQLGDLILMLYRDEYYHGESPAKGEAELIIRKQRNGPTGTARLAFNRNILRFDNLNTVTT